MSRPIIYDVTPFARRTVQDVGGVDRTAFAYGRYLASASRPVWGAYYGPFGPHPVTLDQLKAILQNTEQAWRDDVSADADPGLAAILAWLGTPGANPPAISPVVQPSFIDRAQRVAFHVRCWLSGATQPLPQDAIYLNVFNAGREHHFLFDWLKRRADVQPVFFVHDLLPLDYPEYFPRHYGELTERRLATIVEYGAAFITSTSLVRDRLLDELRRRGRSAPAIHVAPLPSPLALAGDPASAAGPRRQPYFVMIGTIEPRKNHLLLLNLWREFACRTGKIPKLVAVGAPGWENEQALDLFDRCAAIRPHVLKIGRLSGAALEQLLTGAQALLMPSFDEGYGLPVVEALTLGTPVIASDIPVFREITQGCATLLSPLNGEDWRDAILAFADPQSPTWGAAKANASQFRTPRWQDYFKGVEDFLDQL
jgi:glycosyltransferase involved in cell wall biosynthesis